jgi:hypothetical protein
LPEIQAGIAEADHSAAEEKKGGDSAELTELRQRRLKTQAPYLSLADPRLAI